MAQHLSPAAVVALVGLESQVDVGLYGVHAFLLELVGGNLVHQSDASSFLLHVDEHALAFLFDHLHGFVQLFAAVTPLAAEDVARGAGGVYADEDGFVFLPFAFDECHVFQSVALLAEGNEPEVAVLCRHVGFVAHFDERFRLQPVGNHVFDGDDFHVPFLGHLLQFRHAGHGAVFVHDLHEGSGRIEAGHATEVHSGFGVAGATQNAVFLGVERVDMSGAPEGLRSGGWVGECLYGGRAVVCRHAGGASFQLVDGHGERCAEHGCVVVDLMGQVQLLASAQGDGCTEHTAGILEHEVHLLRRDFLRRDDQVAFVLTVFVVNHDDELALLEVFHSFFNAAELKVSHV